MKEKFLKDKTEKELNSIYKLIKDYTKDLKPWQLTQSVTFEKTKTIICKKIIKNEKQCHRIIIKEDSSYYILDTYDNLVNLTKIYQNKEKEIKEKYTINYNDNFLKRTCTRKKSDEDFYYEELLYKYENDIETKYILKINNLVISKGESKKSIPPLYDLELPEIINKINQKEKTRKRT